MASTKTKPPQAELPPVVDNPERAAEHGESAVAEAMTKAPEPAKVEAAPAEAPPEPDLATATAQGTEAFLAIMEAAKLAASDARQSAANAIAVADKFKADMYAMVDRMCQPMLVAAMEYQQLVNRTSENIIREAQAQGQTALTFTKRLKGMTDAVRQHANGDEDHGSTRRSEG